MLSPIVQRRPFPTVWIAAFGVLLYGWVFLSGNPHRSQAAEPGPTVAQSNEEGPKRGPEKVEPGLLEADPGERPAQDPGAVPKEALRETPGESSSPNDVEGERRPVESSSKANSLAEQSSESAPLVPEAASDEVSSAATVRPSHSAASPRANGSSPSEESLNSEPRSVLAGGPAETPVLEALRGRLVDGLGRPLGEWEIQWSTGEERKSTQSSAAGTFVLQGIERGRHSLLLWKPEDLRSFRTEPIATTTSLRYEVVLCDPPRLLARLEGVVRTRSGRTVSGAVVTPVLKLPAKDGASLLLPGRASDSLDEGLLTLREIPDPERSAAVGTELLFWVRGEGLFPELVQWADNRLVVTESAELRVELPSRSQGTEAGTHLACRATEGEALRLVQGEGSSEMVGAWRLPIAGAQSLHVVVPLETTEVFLTRRAETGEWVEGAALLDLRLSPGRLN
ncbi:MAG: hypothetical protein AAF368_12130, partial [Planctomycetota bacterium]